MLKVTRSTDNWPAFKDAVVRSWPITKVLEEIAHVSLPSRRPDGGYKIQCVIHAKDDTPSMHVYEKDNGITCFGACHKSWSAIGLASELMHCSYAEAVRFLGDRIGLKMDDDWVVPMPEMTARRISRPQVVELSNGHLVVEPIDAVFAERGAARMDEDAMRYFVDERVIGKKLVMGQKLGRLNKAFSIPIWGPQGELWNVRFRRDDATLNKLWLARHGREATPAELNEVMPKYFGMKGHNDLPLMVGLWALRRAPQRRNIVIVESELDVLALLSQGVLATSLTNTGGSQFEGWLRWWHELNAFDRVVVAYDNDEAGHKGANALKEKYGEQVAILPWPGGMDGYDVGDVLRKHGPSTFFDLLRQVPERYGQVELAFPVDEQFWLGQK